MHILDLEGALLPVIEAVTGVLLVPGFESISLSEVLTFLMLGIRPSFPFNHNDEGNWPPFFFLLCEAYGKSSHRI